MSDQSKFVSALMYPDGTSQKGLTKLEYAAIAIAAANLPNGRLETDLGAPRLDNWAKGVLQHAEALVTKLESK